jgi:hypothetical protein
VPTIHHRARCLMVGTLPPSLVELRRDKSLCPPYALRFCELICLARKRNLHAQQRQINTTGKSLLIFRNRVKPGNQKYSASVPAQISRITPLVSPDRGALAIVTTRGEMRWTRGLRLTCAA